MLYSIHDRPPIGTSVLIGFQHFLAVFAGILTAPLIIALGMGLSVEETSYLISSSLVVSGFATLVQINRIGPIGSGLLSIQGTSFAFIGPLVFSYQTLVVNMPAGEALGMIFGSCAFCAMTMIIASQFMRYLRRVITTNVAGATIMLLGISLVVSTLQNIQREYQQAGNQGWLVLLLTGLVLASIIFFSRSNNVWLRISCITLGLIIGFVVAFFFGTVDFSVLGKLDSFFVPVPWRYELAVDWPTVLVLMPIFLISATESIGDLTATNDLSGLPTGDESYWQRIQGGILGDAINSLFAAFVCTFPNTTFSQNNGVIRITGVSSRFVGYFVAGFLILFGFFPVVGGIFQAIPNAVIYGATLLMFSLVGFAGYSIVASNEPVRRDWIIVAAAIVLGYTVSLSVGSMTFLSAEWAMILSFPVSTGAVFAIALELLLPKSKVQAQA